MERRVKDSINGISLSEWKDIIEEEIYVKIEGTTNYNKLCQTLQELDTFTEFDINNILLRNLQKMENTEKIYNVVFFGSYGSIEWDW